MFPGAYRPTAVHFFVALLAQKRLLLRNYTQNIDTLERVAGVPADLLVEAHGEPLQHGSALGFDFFTDSRPIFSLLSFRLVWRRALHRVPRGGVD